MHSIYLQCSDSVRSLKLNIFYSMILLPAGIYGRKREKPYRENNSIYIKRVFKGVNLSFLLLKVFRTFFRELLIFRKSKNDANRRGWRCFKNVQIRTFFCSVFSRIQTEYFYGVQRSYYLRHYDVMRTKIHIWLSPYYCATVAQQLTGQISQ